MHCYIVNYIPMNYSFFFTPSNKTIQVFYFTCNNVVEEILRTSNRNRFRIVLFGNLISIKNNLRTKINCEEYF